MLERKMCVVYLLIISCYLGYIPISNYISANVVLVFVSLKEVYLIFLAKLRQRIPICFSQGFSSINTYSLRH